MNAHRRVGRPSPAPARLYITIVRGLGRGSEAETPGDYGAEGFVYQTTAQLPEYDADDGTVRRPVIGSWVIGHEAGGMGVRETSGYVTDNLSQFVPHMIDTWYDPSQYDVIGESSRES